MTQVGTIEKEGESKTLRQISFATLGAKQSETAQNFKANFSGSDGSKWSATSGNSSEGQEATTQLISALVPFLSTPTTGTNKDLKTEILKSLILPGVK